MTILVKWRRENIDVNKANEEHVKSPALIAFCSACFFGVLPASFYPPL
jgi:hypothetical protein